MKMTGMAVMVVAASGLAGVTPAEARQLTICMDSSLGNLSMENAAKTVVYGIFADIKLQIDWRNPAKCPAEAIYVSFSSETPVNEHRGALAYARPYEGTHIVVFVDRCLVPRSSAATLEAQSNASSLLVLILRRWTIRTPRCRLA